METILTTAAVHQGPSKQRPLPSFIKKLWFILTDTSSREHIFWVDNGQVLCIPNAVSFSQVILPRFFKHRNWQSFVRQLNLYGFRKVYQLNLAYDDSLEKRTVWQFKHESFQKDNPGKLCEIKRRATKSFQQQASCSSIEPLAANETEQGDMEKELKIMKQKIEHVDKKRRELSNQVLELSNMITKQQKTIHIFMQFTMQLLEKNPDLALNGAHTIKHLLGQNSNSEFKTETEHYASDLQLPAPRYHQPTACTLLNRPELPSISSLINNTLDADLSTPIKRPKKR